MDNKTHPYFDPRETLVDSKWNTRYNLSRYSNYNLYAKVPAKTLLICYSFLLLCVLSFIFCFKFGIEKIEISLVFFFAGLISLGVFAYLYTAYNSKDYNLLAYVFDNEGDFYVINVSAINFMDFTYLQEFKPKSVSGDVSISNIRKLITNHKLQKKYLDVVYGCSYIERILQQNHLKTVAIPVFKITAVKRYSYFFNISAYIAISFGNKKPRLMKYNFRVCNNISNYDNLYEHCVSYMNATKDLKL